ncbi:hypothetical protein G3I77_35720 [Streptomyces sp. D2-8]|uniref:hypothetical protein n=1 Tax=Streptomyces sp. D2-8 TaxID=2707767 RepID=UPI0020C0FED7|nr:hypothetical protein [Streptomyces sp. D2-8]MCK8438168.1 hypothetical protein [Streptomyces sp. D2-8]
MASTDAPTTIEPSSAAVSPTDAPDLWFELPPGFMEFDLGEDPETSILRMADAADALFATATQEQKFRLVVSSQYILQMMIAAGAEHVSSCLLRMPGDELSQGTLCVIIERPETGPQSQDRQGAAKRTASQWRSMFPDADIGLVMLPYGISALCIRDQELQIPGELFGLADPIPTRVRQAQFCVPLKTGPGSALFVFTTEDNKHWSEYLDVLSGIMKSVSTKEPHRGHGPVVDGSAAAETEKPA